MMLEIFKAVPIHFDSEKRNSKFETSVLLISSTRFDTQNTLL